MRIGLGLFIATVVAWGWLPAVAKVTTFAEAQRTAKGSEDDWNGLAKTKKTHEFRSVVRENLAAMRFPGLKEVGKLVPRNSKNVSGSLFSVGCETLDRDYADWDAYKSYLAPLGVKHGRLFSGWAKTEQKKGVYDFAWLDKPVREMTAMGIRPWICLSYGNPIYGSDFRLGMKVREVTKNPEAFAAWLRYCAAVVERYRDAVDEWEIWNEPFNQAKEYATLFYETAKVVKKIQPTAKVICTAIRYDRKTNDYKVLLEKLKAENALDLGSFFVYHPYHLNPDNSYVRWADPLRALVKSYSEKFDVMQGESGCPAQLEFAHALKFHEWTEVSQAKWDLRRALGDAVRKIPSNHFSFMDLQYPFMLQSFGLIRSNTRKEFVYRRPSYFAMQNVYALIDDSVEPVGLESDVAHKLIRRFDPRIKTNHRVSCATFAHGGGKLRFYWYADGVPSSELGFDLVELAIPGDLQNPHWTDMVTGRICAVPEKNVLHEGGRTVLTAMPIWDSPVLITGGSPAAR